jgi:pilus assembly protein Flp/PilA
MILNIRRYLKNRKGATAIEYGLIAAGIAVVIIVAVNALGDNLSTMFAGISDNISSQNDNLPAGGGGGGGGGEGE